MPPVCSLSVARSWDAKAHRPWRIVMNCGGEPSELRDVRLRVFNLGTTRSVRANLLEQRRIVRPGLVALAGQLCGASRTVDIAEAPRVAPLRFLECRERRDWPLQLQQQLAEHLADRDDPARHHDVLL